MKRILGAFLITVVGIVLSWVYLRPKEWMSGDVSDRKVVAKVIEIKNDVNRQAEGRLLWSSIKKGDFIYLGDKIKTGGLSLSVIQILDSASKLEIEENSTVVMSQGDKKLALNMLEGRVFVKEAQNDLHLLSGGKTVDVKGDTAISVSKDGTSNVESFDQGKTLFGELRPAYSEEVLSNENTIPLTWVKAEKEEIVEVLAGESPLLLKKIDLSARFADGTINLPAKPGINYWQLVTKNGEAEIKSPLMKVKLVRPIPPSQIFPSDKEIVKVIDGPFEFKWIKGNINDSVIIEVGRDQQLKDIILSEDVATQTTYKPTLVLNEGEYFWRVKSRFNKSSWLESPVQAFTVHKGNSIISPTPVAPIDHGIFYLNQNRVANVKFEWRLQQEARSYTLRVNGPGFNRDIQSNTSSEVVNFSAPGSYQWEVLSATSDGKRSVLPIKRSFQIREKSKIQWAMNQKSFLYLDSLPIIILKWEKGPYNNFALKISETPDFANAESFQVQGRDFPYRIQRPGLYYAQVFGTDENGNYAGESDRFDFSVEEAPLPPAPVIFGNAKSIKASPRGDLTTQVQNAKSSWLIVTSIYDPKGRVVDERRFTDDKLTFNGLLPGKYYLQMKFLDEYKRNGETSERVEIEVPEKSQIAAPKLKGIKVR